MELAHFIYILTGGIIALSVFYYASTLHKSKKFNVYLKFLAASAIIFTVFALFFQIRVDREQTVANGIQFFTDLIKDFLDENIKLFIENPEIDYYFKQLMGLSEEMPKKRNKLLETQISMLIFSRSASVLYYIQLNERKGVNKDINIDLESRFLNILNSFFQSSIFRENWYIYNKKLAGNPIRIYFKKYFSKYIKIEFPKNVK